MHQYPKKRVLTRGSLVAFDFDGTLTTAKHRSSWQSVHEHFNTWESHGKVALNLFLDGKINYYEFCKADVYPWINRSEEEYKQALDTIELRDGLSEIVEFFKHYECKLAIISMGLSDIVKKVANDYCFDFWIANDLIWKDNCLTGEVKVNVEMNQKGEILLSILNSYNLPSHKSIAIGDASADIDMFQSAHTSIAIEPSSESVANSVDFVCQSTSLKEIASFFQEE